MRHLVLPCFPIRHCGELIRGHSGFCRYAAPSVVWHARLWPLPCRCCVDIVDEVVRDVRGKLEESLGAYVADMAVLERIA